MADPLETLVHRADLDDLVRHVDATCAARDWDHLVRVRDASRAALSTGRQLWPIATLANLRLALWAPPDLAMRALDETARAFMPGPVSEILAARHRWDDLAPHLPPGHDRSLVAHERALRGDAVDDGEENVLDVPFGAEPWEGAVPVAGYDDDGADAAPPETHLAWRDIAPTVAETLDDPTVAAFRHAMEPWTAQSEGIARAVVVEGGASDAVGALGATRARVAEIQPSHALALLTWAASSGGAHGRRRGTATGRAEAWWTLATFLGLEDPWPCDPEEFGEVLSRCECHALENDEAPTGGWGLGLVVVDRDEGLALALEARDPA